MLRKGLSMLAPVVKRFSTFSPPATTMKMLGAASLGSIGGYMYATQKSQNSTPSALSHQNIHRALITPEQVAAILAQEEAKYDKVREELKVMKLLLTKDQIKQAVKEMAVQIAKQFKDEKHLLVLTMLQGASYFATDLKRELHNNQLLFQEDAIRIGRYGDSLHGSKPKVERLPEPEKIAGRKILIIEDLIEEGVTLDWTINELVKRGAKRSDIYVAVFTNKENARKEGYEHIQPHFVGFKMKDNKWVDGYGCDQGGYARPEENLWYFPAEEQEKFGYRKK